MNAVSHWQPELTPAVTSGWHANRGPMGEQRLVCCRFADCQPSGSKNTTPTHTHTHNKQQPTDTHTKPVFTAEPGLNQGGTEPGRSQGLSKCLQRLRYNKTRQTTGQRKYTALVLTPQKQLISAAHAVADVCSVISSAASREGLSLHIHNDSDAHGVMQDNSGLADSLLTAGM